MKIFANINDPEIITRLNQGEVGVLPSDSVYGLMCLARNPEAVDRLYRLKQRENKPGTLIGASSEQFFELGLSHDQLKMAEQYWPGPVSVVVPAGTTLSYLHLGSESLAVRVPAEPGLNEILKHTGVLQTSSANLTNQPVANTVDEARNYFGDNVDFYVDGGDLSGRQATTILQITDGGVKVLRQGAQQVVS